MTSFSYLDLNIDWVARRDHLKFLNQNTENFVKEKSRYRKYFDITRSQETQHGAILYQDVISKVSISRSSQRIFSQVWRYNSLDGND